MSIAFVGHAFGGGTASTATPATAARALTAGNLNIVCVRQDGSVTLNSVTDTAGNTYTLLTARNNSTDGAGVQIAYARNCLGHPANVVTAHFSAAVAFNAISADEFSGADISAGVIDAEVGGNTTGTTLTSPALTTTNADDLVYVCGSVGDLSDLSIGTGYTLIDGTMPADAGNDYFGAEYKIVSAIIAATAQTIVSTVGTGGAIAVASFKAASAAAASSEKPSVSIPGLDIGRPTSKLRSRFATDQVGQLSALGLSLTVGMADLQPAAASSTEQRPYKPPGIGLGTPASKLRGIKATDQLGQLSALALSITVGQADLQNSTIPGTSPSFNNPELDLGSPLSKLRAKYATDQMGQLSALALSFTVGMADLQGLVATQSTDQRGYVEPGLGLGTPRSKLRSPSATDQQGQLSALGVSVTVGSAELTGSGALSGLGLSMTVGSGDLINDPGAMQALGLSMTVGMAEISSTFTPDVSGGAGNLGPEYFGVPMSTHIGWRKKREEEKTEPVVEIEPIEPEPSPVVLAPVFEDTARLEQLAKDAKLYGDLAAGTAAVRAELEAVAKRKAAIAAEEDEAAQALILFLMHDT